MAQDNVDRSFWAKYYREISVLHGLQSEPAEREWLLSIPKGEVKPAQVVLYLGCNVLRTTHLMRTIVDIFKLMDLDFVAVGGASYCCGIQHHMKDDKKSAQAIAQTTARNFAKFQPETVVMWCPSCIYTYDDIMQMRESFSFQHVTQFLVECLDKMDFQPQPPVKLSLHYHTGREQTDEEARCTYQLLSALPGVSLVDLGADPRLGRQCIASDRDKLGAAEWDGIIEDSLQKSVDAGADIYATMYHGCQRYLCHYEKDYPIKVEHFIDTVGRALGIEHEDIYKKFMLSGNADAIMSDSSPCAAASGIGADEARAVIQKTFVKTAS